MEKIPEKKRPIMPLFQKTGDLDGEETEKYNRICSSS